MDTPPPVSTDHIAVAAAVKLNPNLQVWRWVNAQTLDDWGDTDNKYRMYTWKAVDHPRWKPHGIYTTTLTNDPPTWCPVLNTQ